MQDTLLLQKLEWDASGNVAGMQRPIGDTLGYRHDRLGQLRATARAGGMDSLQYDANGNRVRHRFTLDGGVPDSLAYNANRVAWMRTARNGHTLFRHDVLGNLTLEAHFASAADTTDLSKAWKIVERKFNRRNELERVVVKDRQTMDSTLWAYDYDEAGNRILKRYAVNLDTTQWKTERRYAYDGVNVVADSGRGDSSWTWHVFQGYNRLALADKPGSALRVKYLLNDHLGTANVMVDDTGRVLAKYARDPWGNLESSWESTPLRWQFTGKEQDPEVGGNVFYFNARFYDAERGSFIGRDPKLQFWTPYSYVGNMPLAGIDPNGCELISFGTYGYRRAVNMGLRKVLDAGGKPAEAVRALMSSSRTFVIRMPTTSIGNGVAGDLSEIHWDPNILTSGIDESGSYERPSEVGLVHELFHALVSDRMFLLHRGNRMDLNEILNEKRKIMLDISGGLQPDLGPVPNIEEPYAVFFENLYRDLIDVPKRLRYSVPSDIGAPTMDGGK